MENHAQIDIYIIIGLLAMFCLLMAVFAVFKTYQAKILEKEAKVQAIESEKQLEVFKSGSDAEESVRVKIGQNIHDAIISKISAVKRSLHKNIQDHGTKDFDLERLKKDYELIEQSIDDLRGISRDMVPKTLLTLGLFKALDEYVSQLHHIGDTKAAFEDLTNLNNAIPFSIPDQLNIYRICQELLTNLSKHSGYKFLSVTTEVSENNLQVVFTHDGNTVTNGEIENLTKQNKGLGLSSLKSRTVMLRATLHYGIEDHLALIILAVPF